tara:strand:+ start:2733 stop:3521 length:789 start_codon:yes stop_codon:yes gene_type:complete
MAKIRIEINDENFDIGTFVSAFADNGRVTVNIFTSEGEIEQSEGISFEEEKVIVEDTLPQPTEKQLLNKLARMPSKSVEQTLYAEKLHKENKITWIKIGKALGIGGDSVYRRVQAVHKKLDKEKRKAAWAAMPPAKKVKAKPKPKKPEVPNLSEKDVVEAVYSFIRGNPKGVHFSTQISSVLIKSYSDKYENNKKLEDFKSSIGKKIDDAMSKIALVLGPTACMISRSRNEHGSFTNQLMVYNKSIPTHKGLEKSLNELGLL